MASLANKRREQLQRSLQRLGGMAGKSLRVPEIYDAVVLKLREEPGLSPQQFWRSYGPDDSPIYLSRDAEGRPVLMHESYEERGITLASLKRYFTRARKDLGLSSS